MQSESPQSQVATDQAFELVEKLRRSILSVVRGKAEMVDRALVALAGQGHLLIEDVPGVGKTLLARAIARSTDLRYARIQFTPDLLPSDILGSTIYSQQTTEFSFKPGPIFAQVILADEINRTSPRTQSAMLEAMNEQQVSIDGQPQALPRPFLVLATQNPFEFEGTYPLPESQLDRFMLRVELGYPPREDEKRLLAEHREGEPVEQMTPVASAEEILALQAVTRQVRFEESVVEYLLDLVAATRASAELMVGVSTRGSLTLYRAAQALAVVRGRDYVVPDDVKELAIPVLAHRVMVRSSMGRNAQAVAAEVLEEIVSSVAVPG